MPDLWRLLRQLSRGLCRGRKQERGGTVPGGLAVEVTRTTCRMRSTHHVPARCAALTGNIGEKAACGIYEWRPSPCREFEAGDDACQRARLRHGLPPLAEGLII